MKKLLFLIVFAALAGCATQTQPYGGADAATRQRAKIHTELGAGYYAQGQLAIALEEFTEAVQIDSGYALGYTGLGLVYAALGEDAKADDNFKRALRLDPDSSDTHNNYGTFLCSRNHIDESIAEFLAAVKNPLYTTPESAYLNAGICALKKKDDKRAEGFLLNALQIQPGLRAASYQLANVYFARADFVHARTYVQRAMLNGDPTPEMLWLGVRVERILGDKNAEASYGMLLKNKYPNSEQAKALLSEQP